MKHFQCIKININTLAVADVMCDAYVYDVNDREHVNNNSNTLR